MKYFNFKLILLCLCLFIGTKSFAETINGINYSISGSEATVIRGTYSGDIVIPSYARYYTVTGIDNSAFNNCQSLKSVSLPNTIISIGEFAFEYCYNLKSIVISEGLKEIGRWAFYDCNSLTELRIPASVETIGRSSLNEPILLRCYSLSTIVVAAGNTKYDSRNYCNAIIETATNRLICGCKNTIIPEGVVEIVDNAFYGCSTMTSINIPSTVKKIGYCAFMECSALESITIPSTVETLDEAFMRCGNLTTVTVRHRTPLTIKSGTFSNRANATLIVPTGCKAAYEAANYWKEFKEIIEDPSVFAVGNSGFATYCSNRPMDFSEIIDIKAYIASGFSPSTGSLLLTRVTEVPAGEGLYIKGTPGTYMVPSTITDMFYSNLLTGVTEATTIYPTDGSMTNFILANGSHGVGFYTLSEAGELAAGKAYLQLPTASVASVKELNLLFDDEDEVENETGIIRPTNDFSRKGGEIFNISGQRVSKAEKGIYIVNGKKVFVK